MYDEDRKPTETVFITECPECGGELEKLSLITDPHALLATCYNEECEMFGELFNNQYQQEIEDGKIIS